MKDWLLHHLHFVIVADALLHVIIILLSIAAIVMTSMFIKAVKNHENANAYSTSLAFIMLAIVGFMSFSAIRSFVECAVQYQTWWNK
jgi:ABC-type sulfate transport system permease component